jgi:NAD(P)-dependent dehydrogenase (short-subunit alcohol dehydrogenase family)
MRILVVGASGAVGRAALRALQDRHEIITAGRTSGNVVVDLTDPASIKKMFGKVGTVDAVIAAAGHSHFGPLSAMTEKDFRKGLDDKLMGQINLVLLGLKHIADAGSFTLTTGVLDRDPVRGGANSAAVNGAISAFVRSAALEMPRGIRLNAVSPALLEESASRYAGAFPGHIPVSSARVGQAYVKSVEGALTGQIIIADA